MAMAMHTHLSTFLAAPKDYDNQRVLLWNNEYSRLLELHYQTYQEEEKTLLFFRKHYLDVVRYMHKNPQSINRGFLLLEQMVLVLTQQDMDIYIDECTDILMSLPYYIGLKNRDSDGLSDYAANDIVDVLLPQIRWLTGHPASVTLPSYVLAYGIHFLIHLAEDDLLNQEQQLVLSEEWGRLIWGKPALEEWWLHEELHYWEDYGNPSYLSKVMPLAIISPEQDCPDALKVWLEPLYEPEKPFEEEWDYYQKKWETQKKLCNTPSTVYDETGLWL